MNIVILFCNPKAKAEKRQNPSTLDFTIMHIINDIIYTPTYHSELIWIRECNFLLQKILSLTSQNCYGNSTYLVQISSLCLYVDIQDSMLKKLVGAAKTCHSHLPFHPLWPTQLFHDLTHSEIHFKFKLLKENFIINWPQIEMN